MRNAHAHIISVSFYLAINVALTNQRSFTKLRMTSFLRARVMRLLQTTPFFISETNERFSIFGYKYGSRLVNLLIIYY